MREFFRPYNKVVTISDATHNIVTLTDSAGAPLDSNYIRVESASGTGSLSNCYQVIPSGINTIWGGTAESNGTGNVSGRNSGPSAYPTATERDPDAGETSGVLGILSDTNNQVIISLSPQDSTNALLISQYPGARTTTYSITYGQVNLANSRADNLQNPEEVTYSVPTASFTSSLDTDLSTLTVTDTSIGNPYTRNWEFSAVLATGSEIYDAKTITHSYVGSEQTGPFRVQLSSIGYHGQTVTSGTVTF